MARARNIKPGFFTNEDLAECSPWARLCFIGLWTLADRAGRLEDRPKRVKGELFPYDTVDVEPLLQELERFNFILRYESGGMKAIQIREFAKHQSPHYSEKPSVIMPPALPEYMDHKEAGIPGGLPEDSRKKGAMKRGSQPPDSLNPDSLNPDSLNPESGFSESNTCPERPRSRPVDDTPIAHVLMPLSGKSSSLAITEGQVEMFRRAYPGVDVRAELLRMNAWLEANPTRRKTHSGALKFVNSWLSRAQNDPRPAGRAGSNGMSLAEQTMANAEDLKRELFGDAEEATEGVTYDAE